MNSWHNFPLMSTPFPDDTSMRILLVDDHEDLLLMMRMMLKRKRGYAVETANSGQQALAVASEFSPHLVISDLTMPGMDGLQMMGEMKSQDIAPFKAIALSGRELAREEQCNSGYDMHLTKPVDFDELLEVIDRLIQSAEA